MTALLEVERLQIASCGAQGSLVVEDISFSLERGEVLGLIGESGAGKSTIGLAAIGYIRSGLRLVHGRVLLEGTDLLRLSERQARVMRGRRVAYMAQSAAAAFNPAHRLMPQICEAPLLQRLMSPAECRRQAILLFDRLSLPNPATFGDRYPHQVSGGQLQRAMAAMALIAQPDLLVLDEPTTALDVTTQIEVLAILRRLVREDGLTALYISHDLALVSQLASRVIVLRHGAVVEEGEVEQVFRNPRASYTRALLDARTISPPSEPEFSPQTGLLRLENVSAAYASGPLVLKNVDLHIERGECLAIAGESGSGKSTLARVIVGLLATRQGNVVYKGRPLPPLGDRAAAWRREIQIIHQHPDLALNPQIKIGHSIARPIRLFDGTRGPALAKKVRELLCLVGLTPDIANHYPRSLSGGQKQRVCIARALAARPELLICDEITASLDALVAKEILELLLRLKESIGMACLFITHDLGIVRAFATRLIVLYRGEVVEEGASQRLLTKPSDAYTARLIASIPSTDPGWLDNALKVERP